MASLQKGSSIFHFWNLFWPSSLLFEIFRRGFVGELFEGAVKGGFRIETAFMGDADQGDVVVGLVVDFFDDGPHPVFGDEVRKVLPATFIDDARQQIGVQLKLFG